MYTNSVPSITFLMNEMAKFGSSPVEASDNIPIVPVGATVVVQAFRILMPFLWKSDPSQAGKTPLVCAISIDFSLDFSSTNLMIRSPILIPSSEL